MDILIKYMEMPSCCSSCPFLYAHYGEMGCRFVGRIKEIFSPNRPKDCPLVPVPEHGRLIDVDAVIRQLRKWGDAPIKRDNFEIANLLESLAETDTVLEASK